MVEGGEHVTLLDDVAGDNPDLTHDAGRFGDRSLEPQEFGDLVFEDQLGGLSLTKEGLKQRDRSVFEEARQRKIPVATVLAGGYARRVEDTVRIHVNTILAARDVALAFPSASVARS